MRSLQEDIEDLRRQLGKGSIRKAYRALLSYMTSLRMHFAKSLGDSAVSGLYQGCLDMTYFALFPASLKHHGLKIAIVFNYDAFRFEVWLAARNRKIQQQYWELFRDSQWNEYRVVMPASGVDAIVEYDLGGDFNLSDPDILTSRIDTTVAIFIADMEKVLSEYQPPDSRG